MGSKKHLTPATRNQILGAHTMGVPLSEISANIGCSYRTVQRTIRLAGTRGPEQKDRPRSGAPRKTTKEEDERLYRRLKRSRDSSTWDEIEQERPDKRKQIAAKLKEIDPTFRQQWSTP